MFSLPSKIFGRFVETASYVCRRTTLRKVVFFKKFEFYNNLRFSTKNFSDFQRKFSASLKKLHFTCSQEPLGAKLLFGRIYKISVLLVLRAKNFRFLTKTFATNSTKMHSTCRDEQFGDEGFSDFELTLFGLLANLFPQGYQYVNTAF